MGVKMTTPEIMQNIIGDHDVEVVPERGFVGIKKGTKIRIKEQLLNELFAELYDKTCETYGRPIFVHSYYGYIWKKDGEYIALTVIEENYHYEVITFFILDKLPRGKKLSYTDYSQIVQTVKGIFAEHNLTIKEYLHYHDKTFYFMPENDEAHCILMINPHSLFFALSKKENMQDGATKIIPRFTRKKILPTNSASEIKRAVEACFITE